MPQTTSGGGRMEPPIAPCSSARIWIKAGRSRLSAMARRSSMLSKGGTALLMSRSRLLLSMTRSHFACGACSFTSLSGGGVAQIRSSLPAAKASSRVPVFGMIVYSMASRGPSGFPVIRVLHHPDMLVRLVFDKFEGAGADRLLPHLRRRDMAGIDRRLPGGEQRDQIRLRPLQVKSDLIIATARDLLDIAIPRLARIDTQLLRRALHQRVPGAFDIARGEGLSVMPLDGLTQRKCQDGAVFAQRPARSEIGHNRRKTVLSDMLVKHDEVVEHAHHRDAGDDRRFLVD